MAIASAGWRWAAWPAWLTALVISAVLAAIAGLAELSERRKHLARQAIEAALALVPSGKAAVGKNPGTAVR